MTKFLMRRAGSLVVTMLVVSVVIFVISELAPGNIARNVLGAYTTPAQEQSFLLQMGLDRPLLTRYVSWLFGSDWQASPLIGQPLKRIKSQLGFYEWWAEAEDGSLLQWQLVGADLIVTRRSPDGKLERVTDNGRWETDANGNREFWGVDNKNRAVKWETGPASLPSAGLDVRFSDGTVLSESGLKDKDELSLRLNAGVLAPKSLQTDQWLLREVDLTPLAGRTLSEVMLGVDYRGGDVDFPANVAVFLRDVDVVASGTEEKKVWHGDFNKPGNNYTGILSEPAAGPDTNTTGGIVDAAEAGVGGKGMKVFRIAGSIPQEPGYATYQLFKVDIPVQPGMLLRYRIYYPSFAGGKEVWTLSGSWVRQQGGPAQYIPLQRGFLRGDPGVSIKTGRAVQEALFRRLRNSLMLAVIALIIVIPIALLLGVISGVKESQPIDRSLSLFGLVMTSTPEFALGIFLIVLFATWLKILPGATVFASDDAAFRNPEMLVLPVLTLTLMELGYLSRMTRASMIDVMRQPYIHVARLKGLPNRRVIRKHALRNALIAPITVISIHVNWMIGGIVVVEAIFGFPGLGKYLYDAALFKDVFAIEAGAMIMILIAVGSQLVADIIYTFLNPRIRYS